MPSVRALLPLLTFFPISSTHEAGWAWADPARPIQAWRSEEEAESTAFANIALWQEVARRDTVKIQLPRELSIFRVKDY